MCMHYAIYKVTFIVYTVKVDNGNNMFEICQCRSTKFLESNMWLIEFFFYCCHQFNCFHTFYVYYFVEQIFRLDNIYSKVVNTLTHLRKKQFIYLKKERKYVINRGRHTNVAIEIRNKLVLYDSVFLLVFIKFKFSFLIELKIKKYKSCFSQIKIIRKELWHISKTYDSNANILIGNANPLDT